LLFIFVWKQEHFCVFTQFILILWQYNWYSYEWKIWRLCVGYNSLAYSFSGIWDYNNCMKLTVWKVFKLDLVNYQIILIKLWRLIYPLEFLLLSHWCRAEAMSTRTGRLPILYLSWPTTLGMEIWVATVRNDLPLITLTGLPRKVYCLHNIMQGALFQRLHVLR